MYRWLALIVMLAHLAGAQPQEPSSLTFSQNPIEDFFDGLAVAHGDGEKNANAAYGKLTGSIEAMTPTQIAAGIPIIDRQLDNTEKSSDLQAKEYAANLFIFIGQRPDGPQLLASQIGRLASMLNGDPSHSLDGAAVTTLETIYRDRPDLLAPIFEARLRAPEMYHPGGVASLLALILLDMRLPGDEVVNQVAQYLRRPELADDDLLYTIIGIDKLPVVPDALTAELIRSLDRSNVRIKTQALIGIAKGNPSAKAAARTRIEKIANDPDETAEVRGAAAEALKGEVIENPGSSAGFPPGSRESPKN